MSLKIEKRKLLVVEGTHEEGVVKALLDVRGFDAALVQILPIGGKNKLNQSLQALVRDPQFFDVTSIGIVRDADLSPPGRAETAATIAFEAVRGCLRNAGLLLPDRHASFSDGLPRTGVFIIPDGSADGMMEDLCLRSVADRPQLRCVDEYFLCLENVGVFPGNRSKSRAHAFIASCAEPGVHIGIAAKSGYWDLQHLAFGDLFDFVKAL